MQKLRLQKFSLLSDSVLKVLGQNRIVTILDFLQEDVLKLSTLTKLTVADILAVRNEIFEKYSAPLISGVTLHTKLLSSRSFISTGISRLDAIINGGIPVGSITEICGLADSGKTQLSFQLAINCARCGNNSVLYVDTKGDFSAVRVQKILDALKFSYKEMAVLMNKIKVVYIWTMTNLVELFKSIKNKDTVIDNLSLIIVDSLPCLMFQYLGDDNKTGLSLLNILVNYSRFIGNEFNISLVYVNIQTRWIENDNPEMEDEGESTNVKDTYFEKRNRCLGRYWHQVPALILVLEKQEASDKSDCTNIKVSATNSNSLRSVSEQCFLNICSKGVVE